jgi:hypothetical protein
MTSFFPNILISAAVAFTAHQMGASDLVTFLTFWAVFRIEAVLSNLMAIGKLNELIVGAHVTNEVREQQQRLAAIEQIARNN